MPLFTSPLGVRIRSQRSGLAFLRAKANPTQAKLLAIRRALGANQTEMAKRLESETLTKRISEGESGRSEPNLLLSLKYAKLAKVSLEALIDDDIELPR